MSVLILYEIADEPRSAYLNALEMVQADAKKELFLIDILEFMKNRLPLVGYRYSFYAVVRDRLVWLDSPTSLVPICPDRVIRLVLKSTAHPPLIHFKQYMDFAEKSRMQLYSREDCDRSSSFASRTFHDARQRASNAPRARKQQESGASATTTTFSHSADFFPSSFPTNKNDALQMEDHFAKPIKYVDTPELRGQYEEFADFENANFENNTKSNKYSTDDSHLPRSVSRQDSSSVPYRDEPYLEQLPGRDEERRYASSKYNLDHRGKSTSHKPGGGRSHSNNSNGDSENNLNSIVGEETAAVLTDAVEAAGVAAKSFLTFASSWGKSVIDSVASTTHAAAQSANTNIMHSGQPGKLYPGTVVQASCLSLGPITRAHI